MDQKIMQKGCIIAVGIYILLAIAFFFIGGEQLHWRNDNSNAFAPEGNIGEITADTVILQRLHPTGDRLNSVTMDVATFERGNSGELVFELLRGDEVLDTDSVDIAEIQDGVPVTVPLEAELGEQPLDLRITAPESQPGNAVTMFYGSTIQAARQEVAVGLTEEDKLSRSGERMDGALCLSMETRTFFWFGQHYWQFAGVGLLALALYCVFLLRQNGQGKATLVTKLLSAVTRYKYLIKQLVARDFKTKYKRSVLGILWSFLNPLLTMTVQFVVFSTLFRSNIPNFALYLLIGIVCFSFFSEATSLTLTSILGNASLITKVYVPKYIYPLTRVMSSTINFLLALIPLTVVMLLTRTPVRPAIVLLPLPILCLFALNLGIGMILASSMVFFRDTQFLWGVLSMLWMYATPIFYPESILPAKLMPIFKCNPLYHIIRFMRVVLMDGISPEPKAYALMLLVSLLPLVVGAWIFRKTQDRFVFNI